MENDNLRLDKRFIAKVFPKAEEENVIRWGDYRITVLGRRLFRIERSAEKKFRDDATQAVWFRNVPKQSFHVEKQNGAIVIVTEKCRLKISENREACRIDLGGGELPLSNDGNLKGTYRTLDGCDGDTVTYSIYGSARQAGDKINLDDGFCSRSGVAVYDDSESLTLGADGLIRPEKASGTDEYVFAYGDDYRGAIKALYRLCGSVPVLPRYAFGNWWSRYHAYTDKEYLNMLGEFEKRKIPLTVTALDTDWHYSDKKDIENAFGLSENGRAGEKFVGVSDRGNTDKIGWTGYTFNAALFPDYERFLDNLKERGYHVTMNLHPHQGVRFWDWQYAEMARRMGIDEKSGECVPFDFTDPAYINANFDVLLAPYEKEGVDFWWIDWQQGKESKIEGLDPLWSLNHYHSLDNASSHRRALILSRYFGVGAHRYPVGFSGDTAMTWETLRYLPYFTATATNAGYVWWSHDIGGHNNGSKDDELYLRFVQYGVFSPINRLHCTNLGVMTKEPWRYKNGTGRIAEDFLRLRHSMIPFLYSLSYKNYTEGNALVEPLYYRWKTKEAYEMKNEYLFGGNIIVAPITEHSTNGYSVTEVWLPEGTWTDLFTGSVYKIGVGGEKKKAVRTLESIPVFVESGGILPYSLDEGNGTKNPKKLGVKIFNGNGEFTLYEDSPEGGEGFTTFRTEYTENGGKASQKVFVSFKGERSVFPKDRSICFEFCNVFDGVVYKRMVNGVQELDLVYGETLSVNTGVEESDFEIVAEYERKDERKRFFDSVCKILTEAEGDNCGKQKLCDELCATETDEQFHAVLDRSNVADIVKTRLKEIAL